MKICFAAIEDNDEVRRIASSMASLFELGRFSDLKIESDKLLNLVDEEHCLNLSFDEWDIFLKIVRGDIPDFAADYIISNVMIHRLKEKVHGISEDIKDVISYAINHNLAIIQLPIEEE